MFFTIGHSSRSLDDFLALLNAAAIDGIVDVRSLPGSRKFPWFDAGALAASLRNAGIDYMHEPRLGGRRKRSLPDDDSRNAMWRNASFRRYADYALSQPFADALASLEQRAADNRTAVMCAEAVWWRCHRRIITDYLLAHGHTVHHIMGPGQITTASLTPGACIVDHKVLYPAAAKS